MNGTMRAIVKEKPEVGATYRTDVPIPQITDNEVLVKVRATAICGTDLKVTLTISADPSMATDTMRKFM